MSNQIVIRSNLQLSAVTCSNSQSRQDLDVNTSLLRAWGRRELARRGATRPRRHPSPHTSPPWPARGIPSPFPARSTWARRMEWVVDQHLVRAEDEHNELQRDFEAVLRQCKLARERKYDQATISYLN